MRRIVVPILLILAVTACAGRDTLLVRTDRGLAAARSAFSAEDERQQLEIAEAAKAKAHAAVVAGDKPAAEAAVAEGAAKLATHQHKRDLVTKAFQAAWLALAAASLDPSDLNISRLIQLAALAVAAVEGSKP